MPNRTLNNSRIIHKYFSEFFQEQLFFLVFFLLPCRTEISDPDSQSFPKYTQIIPESRMFYLAEQNPNNSFVTMVWVRGETNV